MPVLTFSMRAELAASTVTPGNTAPDASLTDTATVPSVPGALRSAFADRVPVVTVHDAASHAMAWLWSAVGAPAVPLGVDEFGQSGSVRELYELHDLMPGSIVNAALAALALR